MTTTLFHYLGETYQHIPKQDVQDTSTEAYNTIRKYGVRSKHGQIVNVLLRHPDGLSINEIAEELKCYPGSVCQSMKDLRQLKAVIFFEKRNSSITGKTNIIWGLAENWQECVEMVD